MRSDICLIKYLILAFFDYFDVENPLKKGVFMNPPGKVSLQQRSSPALPPSSDGSCEASSSFVQHQVSIAGLSKALVLKCLWDSAKGEGVAFKNVPSARLTMGMLSEMDIKVAKQHCLASQYYVVPLSFDYVALKPIKTDIGGSSIDTRTYDRYHGNGCARRAIARAVMISMELDQK